MGKLILLLIVAAVLYYVLKGGRRSARGKDREAEAGAPERMVNCSQCGVYLPESEAQGDGHRFFCSEEHRRLFRP